MAANTGVVTATAESGEVVVRIYYDNTGPASASQPLINGPRGWCLDVTNTLGRRATVTVSGVTGNDQTFNVAQGDPVTNGQSRSRTAAQMAALGFTTRGSIGNLTISD